MPQLLVHVLKCFEIEKKSLAEFKIFTANFKILENS